MKDLLESNKSSEDIVDTLTEAKVNLSSEEKEKAKQAVKTMKKKKAGPEYKKAVKTIWDIADKYSDRPITTTSQALKVIDFKEPSLG